VDVGKTFHYIHVIDNDARVVLSQQVKQNETLLLDVFQKLIRDENLADASQILVVVDQPHNIGSLVLRCAKHIGCDIACVASLTMRRATSVMQPGNAKTDMRDAKTLAELARSVPTTLRIVSLADETHAELETLNSFYDDCTRQRTQQVNRLRALLVEDNPEFETALGETLTSPLVLDMLNTFGGPWGIKNNPAKVKRWAAKRKHTRSERVTEIIAAANLMSIPPVGWRLKESLTITACVKRIIELNTMLENTQQHIERVLTTDATFNALKTIPGIGTQTAAKLASHINIEHFNNHEKLASYCGLAPHTTQSGTSIKSEHSNRAGNHTLKRILYLSAFAALTCDPKARTHYDTKRKQGKNHTTAILSLARKRLKIIYKIMKTKTPYQT
jgi:transposase